MQSGDRALKCGAATRRQEDRPLLRLFVYGTLKRGYGNHEAFCRGHCGLRDARVWGRLCEGPGFPFLQVPGEDILARGTAAAAEDVATQARFARLAASRASLAASSSSDRPWGPVHGELLYFDDPKSRLDAIDSLEGFVPGGQCLYHRVLVPVAVGAATVTAWTYVAAGRVSGRRILSGRWPE